MEAMSFDVNHKEFSDRVIGKIAWVTVGADKEL